MEKAEAIWLHKSGNLIKGLILSYLTTGVGLLLLAWLLLKFQLDAGKVSVGILAIYILSGLTGGIYIGRKMEKKRYLWGGLLGGLYWFILMGIRIFSGDGINQGLKSAFLILLICAGSTAFGAMTSGM